MNISVDWMSALNKLFAHRLDLILATDVQCAMCKDGSGFAPNKFRWNRLWLETRQKVGLAFWVPLGCPPR